MHDLHEITKRVIFKNKYDEKEIFFIQDDYHEFILQAMSLNTLDGLQYGYTEPKYWDSYVKFFFLETLKIKFLKISRFTTKLALLTVI